MGISDSTILHKICTKANKFSKDHDLPYHFKTDNGSFETAIEFWAMGYHHPPKSKSWEESKDNGTEIKCPDLLDYEHKLIIEYEEEPKPGKRGGKLGKKGHTAESDKDSHRDQLYRIAGFKLFKIWQSTYENENWQEKLLEFLLVSYQKN